MKNLIDFNTVKNNWLAEPAFQAEYENLELEYKIALQLIKARTHAGFTQEEIASRMGTTQSVIARLESGRRLPSIKTLDKYAHATGMHLNLSFS